MYDKLTPSEAANYLGVTPATLSVWRSTGRHNLPFVKVGHLVYYLRSDIDDWIFSRKKTSTS